MDWTLETILNLVQLILSLGKVGHYLANDDPDKDKSGQRLPETNQHHLAGTKDYMGKHIDGDPHWNEESCAEDVNILLEDLENFTNWCDIEEEIDWCNQYLSQSFLHDSFVHVAFFLIHNVMTELF